MDTSRYIDMFNTKMKKFIADLQPIVVQQGNVAVIKDLAAINSTVSAAQNIAYMAGAPCETFYRVVTLPYAEQILSGDADFFLQKNYETEIADKSIVDTIKQLWLDLSEENQKAMADHIKVLVAISKCVHGAR
jgi:hypothetical protein